MRICSLAFTGELLYDKKNSSRTKGDGCRNGDFRMENLIKAMSAAAGSECVFVQEEMKKHTTFRIGGPADVFVAPKDSRGGSKSSTDLPGEQDTLLHYRKWKQSSGFRPGLQGSCDSALPDAALDCDRRKQNRSPGGSYAFRCGGESQRREAFRL